MKAHPAAKLFPLMVGAELEQLANDIRANGLLRAVVTLNGQVLDGRNRLAACKLAGVQPRLVEWDGTGSPVGYVLSENLKRRHLNESQRAVAMLGALPMFEAEAKKRQRAGLKRGAKAPVGAPGPTRAGRSRDVAAKEAGVGGRSVARAKAISAVSPALIEQIRDGDLTLKQAEKQLRTTAQLAQIAAYVPPVGKFQVIVADPPWPYDDALDGSDAVCGGLPYPAMTVADICALKLPADKDCILWLWTTNAHLRQAYQVLDAWGFAEKTVLTWDKKRMGAGRWLRGITEHCLLAVRGHPTVRLTNETTLLSEARGAHSAKPDSFFRLVEKLCPAKSRLELFARDQREGWVTSGAEVPTSTRRSA